MSVYIVHWVSDSPTGSGLIRFVTLKLSTTVDVVKDHSKRVIMSESAWWTDTREDENHVHHASIVWYMTSLSVTKLLAFA